MADTDPNSKTSRFEIVGVTNLPPWRIYFSSSSNRMYSLRARNGLGMGDWSGVEGQTNMSGTVAGGQLTDTNAAGQRFFRVDVDLP